MRSLYVHFPFCETKCHYCDFYSLGKERTRESDAPTFAKALRQEAEGVASRLAPQLDTLFFGGGTPSMTPPEVMAHALEPLNLKARTTPQTEWTMEANPSSVHAETLKQYRSLGVNRISMGVQSLDDDLLKKLGRVHSRTAAIRALNDLFESGFTNVSVDLLCGVPGQSLQDLERAMTELTSFPITHLSCYLLTLPKHHRMYPSLPPEEEQLQHLLLIDRWMRDRGFEHYEISNFAKPGFRARHNLHYWTGSSYLGLGPSAHSYDAERKTRWKNISSLHQYARKLEAGESAIEWEESLTDEQLELEKWMLALRLDDGIPRDWLDSPSRRTSSDGLMARGLMEAHPVDPTRLRLTAQGFALSDQVIAKLV